MSLQDESRPKVDISPFFFEGSGVSALLIHGLTGTPYEMRYLGEHLAAQGVRVIGVRLAGHATAPQDLGGTTYDDWYGSVVRGLEELRAYRDPIVVVGFSCGAVLGARLAEDQPEAIAGLAILSPAFFLPLRNTLIIKAVSLLGSITSSLYLQYYGDSDIHDRAAALIHPTCRLMPLNAPNELLKLSKLVRPRLKHIRQSVLVMHGIGDHTCPAQKNVDYVMHRIGSAQKHAVMLERSYHLIPVDFDKDRVVAEVAGFVNQFRVAPVQTARAGR